MKKNTLLNKILLLSLSAVISMSILAGCQSKTAKANTTKQGTTKGQRQNGQFNTEDMKNRMKENLDSLVATGTITQSQADKILEALTSNPQGFGGNGKRNNQNDNQSNGKNNNQNNGQNEQQSSGENSQKNNGQNRQGNNALSKLVNDGVITQAQADAVMQKIRGTMNRNQNNSGNQNNNNKQNNQSNPSNQNNSNGNKTT